MSGLLLLASTASVASSVASHAAHTWPWYVIRAAGLVSAGLIVLLMLSGIGLVTGYTFRVFEPIRAWAVHRALGIALALAIMVHVGFLLVDKFVAFSLTDILVPWASGYRPVTIAGFHLGSLWVALGILAFYGLMVIVATSLLIIDRSRRIWRLIHYLSYAVMMFAFLHALYLGTDLASGPWRWLWIIAGSLITGAILHRLYRVGTLRKNS